MNQNDKNQPLETGPMPYLQDQMDDEINLIDLIYPIYKRRKFLIVFCLAITIAIGFVSILSSKTYEATAIILPESSDSSSGVGGELSAAFLEQFGVSGIGSSGTTSTEIFEAVLNSSELALDVLGRYNYFSVMGVKNRDANKTSRNFMDSVEITKSQDDPTISVSVQSDDPVLAADIANSYVKALDRYNLTNTFTSAQRLREYIEQRLEAADTELDQAQKELQEFQERNKAVSIEKQTEATLNVLADMEAQRVVLEVEKAAKEKFYKGPHREIEQLEAQMEALQKNIDRLTYSEEATVPIESEEGKVEFYIPLTRIPALNFDESRLQVKVKAKTGVITMLTTQLEQTKLDEAKDIPTINILEWAEPPEKPIKPKVKLNVVLGFIVSLFIGIFVIFLMEFAQRMDQDPETAPKWQEIKKGFSNLIPFLKKSKY